MSQEANSKRKAQDASLVEQEEQEEEQEEDDDERICRFCFDGASADETLIAPCHCKGGQKYIHLSCLRQWQRMVLVSQPTHPDFWEDDVRHQKCNVCVSDFKCPPPTRQELMLGFTGPEIAALISEGCIIASHTTFNRNIEEQMREHPMLAELSSVQHWLRGVYLITKVEEDKGDIEWTLEDERDVDQLFRKLDMSNGSSTTEDNRVPFIELADGSKYALQTEGSLWAGRTVAEMNKPDLRSLLLANLPTSLFFCPTDPSAANNNHNDFTDDKVAAVNLTRPFTPTGKLHKRADKTMQETKTQTVDVTFFRGGPCEDHRIVTCLVLGGRKRGYTVVSSFRTALLMAKRNALQSKLEGRNNIAVGQHVTLQGLCQRPDWNGRRGAVQAYVESEGRFEVRLWEEEQQDNNTPNNNSSHNEAAPGATNNPQQQQQQGVITVIQVRPANLVAHSSGIGRNGSVLAFVGNARWTRVQLLGEIAKTSWGLCQFRPMDLVRPAPTLYERVSSRLVYAPPSEMSRDDNGSEDEHQRDRADMVALRRGAMEAAQYVQEGGGE